MDGRVACQHCREYLGKAGKENTSCGILITRERLFLPFLFIVSGIRRQMLAGSTVAILSLACEVSPHAVQRGRERRRQRRGRQRLERCVSAREPRPVDGPQEAGRQRRKQGFALEPLEGGVLQTP